MAIREGSSFAITQSNICHYDKLLPSVILPQSNLSFYRTERSLKETLKSKVAPQLRLAGTSCNLCINPFQFWTFH
jgi:hypothetical protein